jgi:histidinol-phosphate aminotransferase
MNALPKEAAMAEGQGVSRRQFLQVVGGTTAAAAVAASLPRPAYALAAPPAAEALTILAYNENPFGMFPAARDAVIAAAASGNRYPKQTADALRDDIARLLGVDSEMVALGAGSIEPLKIVTELFSTPGHGPVVAEPTFEAVVMYAGLSNIQPIKVPLAADHAIDLDHMLDSAKGAGLVYICNPNNPTAAIVDKDAMRAFFDRAPGDVPVMVDEAYHEWVDNPRYESCVRYVKEGRNVIVLRTFSKVYGLAGLRVGYAVASRATAERIVPHRLQNSLNTAGLAAARASLGDQASAAAVRARNAKIRSAFLGWLEQRGFKAIPSDTNFVMVEIGRPVPPVIEALKQRGFLVGRLFPSMPTHLRISLGTEEQMARFQPALSEVLKV